MVAYLSDWVELLLRWFHVVAGIAWIGESFYFVMLDLSLRPPIEAAARARGVSGEFWAVHGGGFYNSQKYLVAPPRMPEHLHWSKWKAYATWLSGFGLFLVLYLLQPDTFLVDSSVADIPPAFASVAAVAFLAVFWALYDGLCQALPRRPRTLGVAVGLLVLLCDVAATHLFSGRAAFLIVGAAMATSMAANVFFVIIPGQRLMVEALARGRTPDALPGIQARQRSVHNTYFTLPVVFTMISNHYAATFGGPQNWLVLAVIMAAGAMVRLFFVIRHTGRRVWALPAWGAALLLAAMIWLAPPDLLAPPQAGAAVVRLADIQPIIERRCAECHAAHPTLLAAAPEGIMFDTAGVIEANAQRIYTQVVQARAMPLGNVTGITDAERQEIGAWVQGGAKR
jgi:uncharacterized membrane protein